MCLSFSVYFKIYVSTCYSVLQIFAPYNMIPVLFPLDPIHHCYRYSLLLYLGTDTEIFISLMSAAVLKVQLTKFPVPEFPCSI